MYKQLSNGNEVSLGIDDPAALTLGDWTDRNLTFGVSVDPAQGGYDVISRLSIAAEIDHHFAFPGASSSCGCVR